jgi:hypothetical protein
MNDIGDAFGSAFGSVILLAWKNERRKVRSPGRIPLERIVGLCSARPRLMVWISPDGQPLSLKRAINSMVVVRRMRLGCIILSSILLSCLSIQALALDPGDIAEPSISAPDMTMPVPKITGPVSSGPNMDMPKPEVKSLIEPDNNTTQTKPTGDVSPIQTQESQKPKILDVSGKWSIKFDKRTDRSLDLNLWASGKNGILGYGTMTAVGAKYSVTASGSINGQELTLTTKSSTPEYAIKKFDEYDLDLFMVNNTLSGTYVLSSDGQSLGEGNATGIKQQ